METHGWEHVSAEAKHLVRHMLRGDPRKRYTLDQVLAHPWIAKNNANSRKILSNTVKNFVRISARQRFRGAIRVIIMMNRLRALTSSSSSSSARTKRKRRDSETKSKKKNRKKKRNDSQRKRS